MYVPAVLGLVLSAVESSTDFKVQSSLADLMCALASAEEQRDTLTSAGEPSPFHSISTLDWAGLFLEEASYQRPQNCEINVFQYADEVGYDA
jgi:hypothetical protein